MLDCRIILMLHFTIGNTGLVLILYLKLALVLDLVPLAKQGGGGDRFSFSFF